MHSYEMQIVVRNHFLHSKTGFMKSNSLSCQKSWDFELESELRKVLKWFYGIFAVGKAGNFSS